MGAKKQVIIVGGGASGMVAAISRQKRKGADDHFGKKSAYRGRRFLATGNGRCNSSTNINLDAACYPW